MPGQPNPNQEPDNQEETGEAETLDFSQPDFVMEAKNIHAWRQHGPYVLCRSCELEHATYIGMEKLMTGIDEKGLPVLVDRQSVVTNY